MPLLQPLVSIIIPCYNSEQWISESIESVLRQTYSNWEVILIDDGSSDNTVQIIQLFISKDSRIKYYLRDRLPKGGSVCRNIGLEKSRGNFIIFLDSDDILADYCLEQRVTVMLIDSKLDFGIFLM